MTFTATNTATNIRAKTKGLAILGATGSIGSSTLRVVEHNPDRYRIIALTANRNVAKMVALCVRWQPKLAAMADPQAAYQLQQQLAIAAPKVTVATSSDALSRAADHPKVDCVIAAITGAASLIPTLAAVKAAKRILLASKEALVMSGQLFIDAVTQSGAELLPIDSEHNAIFQCLPLPCMTRYAPYVGIKRIILTASGGPFRTHDIHAIYNATPADACAHPNWSMGKKISIDSATMMNKGLELIEACWLFAMPPEKIDVVVHPQSIVHSIVEYKDGTALAQLGLPDMRIPIAHALAWPERTESGVDSLDLTAIGQLDFEAPDLDRFPCLRLATEVAKYGGSKPAILNAANEVAVEAFIHHRLRFPEIATVNQAVVDNVDADQADDIDTVMMIDAKARIVAEQVINNISAGR